MTLRTCALALVACLLLTVPLSAGDAGKPKPAAPAAMVDPRPFLGTWEEQWGDPGTTDVAYQDRYLIEADEAQGLKVVILERGQRITDTKVLEGQLSFDLHTDAFENHFVLSPQKDGTLKGTATNPKGVFPIVWTRVAPPQPTAISVDFREIRVLYQPPAPPYPAEAKAERIQGTVILSITISTEGVPTGTEVVEGPEALRATAKAYALAWRFAPVLRNGKPQSATFRITFPFRLR